MIIFSFNLPKWNSATYTKITVKQQNYFDHYFRAIYLNLVPRPEDKRTEKGFVEISQYCDLALGDFFFPK